MQTQQIMGQAAAPAETTAAESTFVGRLGLLHKLPQGAGTPHSRKTTYSSGSETTDS